MTVTFPVGVADLAVVFKPLTCTRTATGRPATGRRLTAVMAVAVGRSHLNMEVPSTAMHEVAETHEIDSRETPGSMLSGDDQVQQK